MKAIELLAIVAMVSPIVAVQGQERDHSPGAVERPVVDDEASAREHVAPEPPTSTMPNLSHREMVETMAMDDQQPYHRVQIDRLEWQRADSTSAVAWEGQAFRGGDLNKVGLKSEGEAARGRVLDARLELVWDRVVARWWSAQIGVRHDRGEGPTRDWLAVGTQGLAPYFFDVDVTAYLGEAGRTAARLSADIDVLLTQRLILRPQAEINAYGRDDPARGLMSGVSDVDLGLRLRYEIRREVAPYVGVSWISTLGRTADLRRQHGEDSAEWNLVAGFRFNF